MRYLALFLLLAPLVFAQSGSVTPTEQVYRFDSVTDPPCTVSITQHCIKAVRFWTFVAGVRSGVVDVPAAQFIVASGVATAKIPTPTFTGRYSAGFPLYATHVAVDGDGQEIEAVPLSLLWQKRPKQGVEFKLQ